MTLNGIDVSVYNTVTNSWADFVFARCTSATNVDQRYEFHKANTRKMGVPFGAYHFGYGSSLAPIWQQAEAFLAAADDADLLALDLEGSSVPMSTDEARSFIKAVQDKGRKIGLYHSLSGYPSDALGADWRWVAYYSDKAPSIPWDIWQRRGMPLDLDRFRGTTEELLALGNPDTTGDQMGITVQFFDPLTTGVVSIPSGTGSLRISDGTSYTTSAAATGRTAVKVIHAGSIGFQVDLAGKDGGSVDAHFVREANVGFTPTPATDCTAQVSAAVAVEHEKNRKAALAAVDEAIP